MILHIFQLFNQYIDCRCSTAKKFNSRINKTAVITYNNYIKKTIHYEFK